MFKQSKIIVFDFDGVVCDSTDECMVSSWNAWEKLEVREGFRRSVSDFTEEECNSFRKLRPRVRGAGEYYIIRRALSEGLTIDTQENYSLLEKKWADFLNPFKQIFFEMRNRLRQENIEHWIDLHPIYDGVIDVMKELHSQKRLYIATLKDEDSVRLILGKHGVVLPKEKILDQSKITTKVQALNKFREQLNCEMTDMIFIDDNVTHLIEPKSTGYPVYLTTWGSPLDEYLHIAELNQIPLLDDCTLLLSDI